MLVIDTSPVIIEASMNPAETFAQSGAILLGLTTPLYNGQRLDVPPRTVLQPEIRVAPLRPPIDGFRYQAEITGVPRHVVRWRIQMPPTLPPGSRGWVAGNVYAKKLKRLIAALAQWNRSTGVEVDPRHEQVLADIPDGEACTLVFRCHPGFEALHHHTYHHELQHVADHIWLTRQILGRWDAILEEMHREGKIVVGRRGTDVADLGSLFSYSRDTRAIFSYWWTAMKRSGFKFHGTEEGASPVARVVDVAGNTVVVELRIRRLITRPPDLVHAAPHGDFQVRGCDISGSEADLSYGTPEKLRFRLVPVRSPFYTIA
ncbi:MAG: hypothetical protein ABJE95_04905 [Byssovorax sp.]